MVKKYQYLSLLGATLFSISVWQMKPDKVLADTVDKDEPQQNVTNAVTASNKVTLRSSEKVVNSDSISENESNNSTVKADKNIDTKSSVAGNEATDKNSLDGENSDSSKASEPVEPDTSVNKSGEQPITNDQSQDDKKTGNDSTTMTDYESATPVVNNPKAVVPKENQKLSNQYTFIPKFNGSGKTVVSVIGAERATTKPKTISASLVGAVKGQVGFKYTNVGYDADGNSMDLEIRFDDWGRLSELGSAYVETYTDKIYSNFPGAGWVDVRYRFVRSDSGQPENVTGLMTLTDIDGSQTVGITNQQWANIDHVYIPESQNPLTGKVDNWLRYAEIPGYVMITSPSTNSSSDAEYAMLTFTYTNQNSLTFRYSDGRDATTPTKMTVWGVNYIPQKPLATETIAPKLQAIDNAGKLTSSNTLSEGQESYQYQIIQQIPDEWQSFYYNNMRITATLPERVLSYTVHDLEGHDVTEYFVNKSQNNYLDISATKTALNSESFYGKHYIFTITVKAPVDTPAFDQFNAQVTTTIDDVSKDSGLVTTTLYNQHQIVVHYYKKGTTNELAADEVINVIDGQVYQAVEKIIPNYRVVSSVRTAGVYDGSSDAYFYYQNEVNIRIIYRGKKNNDFVILKEVNAVKLFDENVNVQLEDFSKKGFYPDERKIEKKVDKDGMVIYVPYTYAPSGIYVNPDWSTTENSIEALGNWTYIQFTDASSNGITLKQKNGQFKGLEYMDSESLNDSIIKASGRTSDRNGKFTFKNKGRMEYSVSKNGIVKIKSDCIESGNKISVSITYDKFPNLKLKCNTW